VLSADAWSAFEEAASPETGVLMSRRARYREQVLESGGSRRRWRASRRFRGREPTIDALLRHQGLA
jgi:oligopeptidase A